MAIKHTLHTVTFTSAEVEQHFVSHPDDIDKKRGIELLVGSILSRVRMRVDGFKSDILIPVRQPYKVPPTVSNIIADDSLHSDAEVDIYLTSNDSELIPVQVTRLEEHYNGTDCTDGLVNLINRKSLVQPDKNIRLAILADVAGDGNLDSLRDRIESTDSPFGAIYLIGQFGDSIRTGCFGCQKISPELCTLIEIRLDW